jgi:hypothetical protein
LKQASEKTIRTIGIYFIIVIQSQPLFAMHYKRKNRKYQFYSLWFNPTASRTHQSNRTRGYNHAVYDEYIVKSNQTHCYFILKVYFTAVISLILYKKSWEKNGEREKKCMRGSERGSGGQTQLQYV